MVTRTQKEHVYPPLRVCSSPACPGLGASPHHSRAARVSSTSANQMAPIASDTLQGRKALAAALLWPQFKAPCSRRGRLGLTTALNAPGHARLTLLVGHTAGGKAVAEGPPSSPRPAEMTSHLPPPWRCRRGARLLAELQRQGHMLQRQLMCFHPQYCIGLQRQTLANLPSACAEPAPPSSLAMPAIPAAAPRLVLAADAWRARSRNLGAAMGR